MSHIFITEESFGGNAVKFRELNPEIEAMMFNHEGVPGIIIPDSWLERPVNMGVVGTERVTGRLSDSSPTGINGICSVSLEIAPDEPTEERAPSPARGGRPIRSTVIDKAPVPMDGEFSCEVSSWEGQMDKDFVRESVAKILIPEIRDNVKIVVPHGYGFVRADFKGRFAGLFLAIWSGPIHQTERCPDTAWGINIRCKDNIFSYHSNGSNIPIIDPGTDTVLGEINDRILYMYSDFIHTEDESQRYIIIRFLEEAVIAMKAGAAMSEVGKDRFDKWKAEARDGKLARLEEDLSSAKHKEQEHRKCCEEYASTVKRTLMEIEAEKVSRKTSVADSDDWELIKKLPAVKTISAIADFLVVHTNEIICTDNRCGSRYRMGEYAIIIPKDCGKDINICSNTSTNKEVSDGYGSPHPHVCPDEKVPCLGNLKKSVAEARKDGDYFFLVQMLIVFLESYNQPGHYTSIRDWKLLEKGEEYEKYKESDGEYEDE